MTHFECEECFAHVHDFCLDTPPDPPLCQVCRWIIEMTPDNMPARLALHERMRTMVGNA